MYTAVNGVLLYSGSLPQPSNTGSGGTGSLLLDTSLFYEVLSWTVNDPVYFYSPSNGMVVFGVSIWKIDNTNPTTRSFVGYLAQGEDFNQGDVVDLTNLLSNLGNNADIIFVAVCGGSGGGYEIPTRVTILSGDGAETVDINDVQELNADEVPPEEYNTYNSAPQLCIRDDNWNIVSRVNDYVGLHINSPTNNTLIRLIRQVPDL